MSDMIKVDPVTHRYFENNTGVNWVNETSQEISNLDAARQAGKIFVGYKGDQSYSMGNQQLNFKTDFHKAMQQNIQEVDHDIWRQVNSDFYNKNPQQALNRFLDFSDHSQGVFFDIETLGAGPSVTGPQAVQSIKDGTMSPVEFSFMPFNLDDGNLLKNSNAGSLPNMLVKPSDAMVGEYTDLLNNLANQEQSAFRGLTDTQQRTLVSLMNYSDGLQVQDGGVVSHAFQNEQKGIAGLGHLVEDQYGIVDFSSSQNLDLQVDGKTRTINPLQKAREGLDNLQKHGLDQNQAVKKLQNTIEGHQQRGIPFVGYNSVNFDQNITNKLLSEFGGSSVNMESMDLYQILESSLSSPEVAKGIFNDIGIDYDPSRLGSGTMALETLTQEILGQQEYHRADLDNRQLAKIYSTIKNPLEKHINELGMKGMDVVDSGNVFEESSYMFDMMGLKQGDQLFSTSGHYNRAVKDLDNFEIVDGVPIPKESGTTVEGTPHDYITKEGNVTDERAIIKSKESYRLGKQYKTEVQGKEFFGLELVNERTGEKANIHRESLAELQNFTQERFEFTQNLDNEMIDNMNQKKLDDLARSRLRKITSTRGGGGYFGTKKYTQAVNELQNAEFIDSQGHFTRQISVDEVSGIKGIGDTKLRAIKQEFGDTLTTDITEERLKNVDGLGEKLSKRVAGVIDSKAGITDASEMHGLVNEYMHENEDIFRGIFSFGDNHLTSMQRDFVGLAPKMSSEKDFWNTVVSEAEKLAPDDSVHGRALNIQRGALISEGYETYVEEMGIQPDSVEPPPFQKYEAKVMFGNEEKTLAMGTKQQTSQGILFGSTNVAKADGEIDTALRRDVLKDTLRGEFGETLEDISSKDKMDEINRYIEKGEVSRASDEIAEVMHSDKSRFVKENIEVENIKQTNKEFSQNAINSVKNNMTQAAKRTKNIDMLPTGKVSSTSELLSDPMSNFLDQLDENLDRHYNQQNLGDARPAKIKNSFLNLVDQYRQVGAKSDKGMALFPNMSEDAPMITMAMFDSENSRLLYDQSIEELRNNKSVTMIDVPLIGKDGTIKYGKQEKVAPTAFIDRLTDKNKAFAGATEIPGMKNTYSHSAVDRIMMELDGGHIKQSIEEGNYQEATRRAHKAINKGMLSLDSSSSYVGDHHSLDATGKAGKDSLTRNRVIFEKFYNPFGSEDEMVMSVSDPEKSLAYVEGKNAVGLNLNILSGELEKDPDASLENVIRKVFGEDFEYSFASGRGDSMVNHFAINTEEIREEVPLGYLNDPGRPNMVQQMNVRGLHGDFKEEVGRRAGLKKASYFGSEKPMRVADDLFESRMKMMNDYDIFGKISNKFDELTAKNELTSKEKNLYDALGNIMHGEPSLMPTTSEDQFLVNPELIGKKYAEKTMPAKVIDAEDKARFKDEILDAVKGDGSYELEYGEDIYKFEGVDGKTRSHKFDKKVKTFIDDIKEFEDGSMEYITRQQYTFEEGTKILANTEKGTLVNPQNQALFDFLRGGDETINFIGNPDYAKHQGYGDVATGYIKDAIHKANTEFEHSTNRVEAVRDAITESFGLQQVKIDEETGRVFYQNSELIEIMKDSKRGLSNKDVSDLFDELNKAVDGKLNKDEMMQSIHMSDVNENFYASSLGKELGDLSPDMDFKKGQRVALGDTGGQIAKVQDDGIVVSFDDYVDGDTKTRLFKGDEISELSTPRKMSVGRGAKFGPSEMLMFKAQQQDYTYEMLKKEIAQNIDPATKEAVKEEYLALTQLHSPETFDKGDYKVVKNLDKEMKKLRRNSVYDSKKFKQGVYTKEQLKDTILDPEREGFVLDLPKEAKITVGSEKSGIEERKLNEVFMPRIKMKEQAGGSYAPEEVAKTQREFYNNLEDYYHNLNRSEGQDAESVKKSWQKVERSIAKMHDSFVGDLTDKSGNFKENIASTRPKGSGVGLLKSMNPGLGLDAEAIKEDRGYLVEQIKERITEQHGEGETARKAIQRATGELDTLESASRKASDFDPTDVYVSKERAMDLLGLENERHFDDPDLLPGETPLKQRVKDMKSGKGVFGQVARPPTNYPGSVSAINVKVDENLTGTNTKMSWMLTKSLYGDSDGDTVSINIAGEFDEEKAAKELNKSRETLTKNYYRKDPKTGKTHLTVDAADDLVDDILSPKNPIDKIDDSPFNNIRPFVGKEGQSMIAKAKGTNPAYSGYVYNKSEQLLQIGSDIYMDDMDKFKELASSLGKLKELPISGKHATSVQIEEVDSLISDMLDGVLEGDDPGLEQAMEAKKELASFSHGDVSDKISGMKESDLLNIRDLTSQMNRLGYDIKDPSSELFLSERSRKHGPLSLVETIENNKNIKTHNKEIMLETLKDEDFVLEAKEQSRRANEKLAERSGADLDVVETKARGGQEQAEQLLKGLKTKKAAGAGLGLAGTAAVAAGAFVAGGMMSSSGQLPMDDPDLNQPGLTPRGNTQDVSASVSQDSMNAYEYNVTGNVPSTIGEDPEQLAGMVAQNLDADALDITLNSNDNREEVSQDWLEEQILKFL